jgi:Bardet-Biedl syndrome 5 protein
VDGEGICECIPGVCNLSKDTGQLGKLWLTNFRVVWAAELQESYNCSVPYLQVLLRAPEWPWVARLLLKSRALSDFDTCVIWTILSLQVKSAKSSRTKFGVVLVVETYPVPQKYMLGFQILPLDRLEAARAQLEALIAASRLSPNYGLQASEFIDPTHLSDQLQESSSLECESWQP